MTDRELMQQALEALLEVNYDQAYAKEVTALRERLAQPEFAPGYCQHCKQYTIEEPLPAQPEPVAWHEPGACGNVTIHKKWAKENGWLPLYIAPPRREWVGLTEKEIALICGECAASAHRADDISYARAIEAKLKEKNQ